MPFDTRTGDRAKMLACAEALGWPRVWFKRTRTGYVKKGEAATFTDYLGPGIVPWHLCAEQAPPDVIALACRSLALPDLGKPKPRAMAPAADPPEPGWAEGVHGPSKMMEVYSQMESEADNG